MANPGASRMKVKDFLDALGISPVTQMFILPMLSARCPEMTDSDFWINFDEAEHVLRIWKNGEPAYTKGFRELENLVNGDTTTAPIE